MKTRVEKGLGCSDLAFVFAVAPNTRECCGTVGAFAPVALAVGLVDSRGFP
jgi:hypothetical protein